MKFIHEPDGADEPTIWVLENGDTDQYQYTHLFSRVDLGPDARRFWPDVVARMTGTTDDALRSVIDRLSKESDSWHGIAMDTLTELGKVKAERDELAARMTGTTITSPGEREPGREEHNAVQGQWDGGEPGNAAPMPATTTATPDRAPLTGTTISAEYTHDGVRADKAIHPRGNT